MNERRLVATASLLLALLSGACSHPAAEAPPLQGAAIGGLFTLIDQNGRTVSDTDFAGRYRLIYFGYTYCPDVCPVDLQLIGGAMRRLDKSDPALAAKVQPIFISVDPERDTPRVLKDYVAAFYPRLVGLTGSPREIAAVAKRYGVYYAKEAPEKGASGYMVDHSRAAILFGPKGEPLAVMPHDQGPEGIAVELRRWVR